TFTLDDPAVADLSARRGVEGVPAELEREASVLTADSEDIGLDLDSLVADELLLRLRVELLPSLAELVGREGHAGRAAVLPGALALRLERGLEPLEIHGIPPLPRDQLGQVERESEGVIELEGICAVDDGARLDPLVDRRALRIRELRRQLRDPLHPR